MTIPSSPPMTSPERRSWGRLMPAVLSALGGVVLWLLHRRGYRFGWASDQGSLVTVLSAVFFTVTAYQTVMLALSRRFRNRASGPNEIRMLSAALRFVAVIVGIGVVGHMAGFSVGTWAAGAGFIGLLMGWSLQAPVSGLAAWLLICIRRPFRVGDRVKLQAWDLRGDIAHIGMMYTELNQVGGTVGSEDLAGRSILVPNAMLFGNIVVNYTPQQASAFVLDEVIVRMTYNSDWALAELILMNAATDVTGDIIQRTGVQPYIRAAMYEYGVQLFLRYMTPATDRPRITYEITKRIVAEFARSDQVDFALPFVFSHRTGMHMTSLPRRNHSDVPTIKHIPLEQITASSAAENTAETRELAEKISQFGLLQPIVVRAEGRDHYVVVAGEHRLAACRQLGWTTIPCWIRAETEGFLAGSQHMTHSEPDSSSPLARVTH